MNDTGAIAQILDSEIVRNLLGPVTRQLGLIGGDLGEIARFYNRRNLNNIFKKWAQSGRILNPDDFERVLPLLHQAAMVSDDELQNRFAALLESAVADPAGFLPSFGSTLLELTSEEAQFLDRLWKVVTTQTGFVSDRRPGMDPVDSVKLISVFDPSIETGINPAEWALASNRVTREGNRDYERLTQAELVIQDLQRLGILTREIPRRARNGRDYAFPEQYSLTQYGVSFIRAVTSTSRPPVPGPH